MAIISISRGTYTGGQTVAQCLAERLGYRCLSREELINEATTSYGLPIEKFKEAMDKPPKFWERLINEREVYLNFFRAALSEHARKDNLVFHGHVGHLLLPRVSHVIRIRVIDSLDARIEIAMQQHGIDRAAAKNLVQKTDKERSEWVRFLWGIDWHEESLYDAVLNLSRLGVSGVCDLIANMAQQEAFKLTAESTKAIEDAALSNRVWTALALDPSIGGTNLKVAANDGAVVITGTVELNEIIDMVISVAKQVEGVKSVRCDIRVNPPIYDIGL